jgi:predicted secreted protein
MVRFEEDANGRDVSLRAGDEFEVSLAETRTTGFKWVVEKGGDPVCTLLSESAEAPAGPPGRAGTHTWHFRAAGAGQATIRLHHRRPWESGAEPGRIFRIQVHVTS